MLQQTTTKVHTTCLIKNHNTNQKNNNFGLIFAEIIGHIETIEGKELGELVIINKSRGRGRPKVRRRKNRFTCNICNRGFSQRSRYVMHKYKKFFNYWFSATKNLILWNLLFLFCRNFHKDEKYECAECKKLYNSKDNLLLHQKTTGHSCEEPKISENVEKETEPTVETAEIAESEHVELKMEVSNEKVEHSEQSDTPTNTEMSQFCNEDCDKVIFICKKRIYFLLDRNLTFSKCNSYYYFVFRTRLTSTLVTFVAKFWIIRVQWFITRRPSTTTVVGLCATSAIRVSSTNSCCRGINSCIPRTGRTLAKLAMPALKRKQICWIISPHTQARKSTCVKFAISSLHTKLVWLCTIGNFYIPKI